MGTTDDLLRGGKTPYERFLDTEVGRGMWRSGEQLRRLLDVPKPNLALQSATTELEAIRKTNERLEQAAHRQEQRAQRAEQRQAEAEKRAQEAMDRERWSFRLTVIMAVLTAVAVGVAIASLVKA